MQTLVSYGGLDLEVAEGTYPPLAEMLPTAELTASLRPHLLIDLGCGVGTQGLYVAKQTGARVWGVDRSHAAIECAQRNAARHGARGSWRVGDMFGDLPRGEASVIVNTLPYEPKEWYEDCEPDGTPPSTYVGDGSFGAALYYGHAYAPRMAVYGMPQMASVFPMAGWDVEVRLDTPDGASHYILRSTHG